MASRDRSPERHDGSSPPSPSLSEPNSNAAKPSSIKDRKCPFCDQSFTSSSLGRHLDTFIRPRNPKPPDGIHNVLEIRKMRSAITRRHARVSAAREHAQRQQQPQSPSQLQRVLPDGATPSQGYPPPTMQPPAPQAAPMEYLPSRRLPPQPQPVPNKAHWTATGVINDLPARASATPSNRELPLPHSYRRESIVQDHGERRTAHATEMAFKEVLRLIHDAADRAKRPPLFEFDFFAIDFPALCLHLLPTPPGIFSTSQPAPDVWPLEPPGHEQHYAVRQILKDRLRQHDTAMRHGQRSGPDPDADADADHQMNGDHSSPQHCDSEDEEHHAHLTKSYSHWSSLSGAQKSQIHHLETARAYAEEATRRKSASTALDEAQAEIKQLRMQLANTHTAGLPYLSQSTIRSLIDTSDLSAWNFDDLVTRWRYAPPSAQTTTDIPRPDDNTRQPHDSSQSYPHPRSQGHDRFTNGESREQYLGNNTFHVAGYAPSAPTPSANSVDATSPATTAAGMTPRTEGDRHEDSRADHASAGTYNTGRQPPPQALPRSSENMKNHPYGSYEADWGLADGVPRVNRDRIYKTRGSLPDGQLPYGAVPGEVEMDADEEGGRGQGGGREGYARAGQDWMRGGERGERGERRRDGG